MSYYPPLKLPTCEPGYTWARLPTGNDAYVKRKISQVLLEVAEQELLRGGQQDFSPLGLRWEPTENDRSRSASGSTSIGSTIKRRSQIDKLSGLTGNGSIKRRREEKGIGSRARSVSVYKKNAPNQDAVPKARAVSSPPKSRRAKSKSRPKHITTFMKSEVPSVPSIVYKTQTKHSSTSVGVSQVKSSSDLQSTSTSSSLPMNMSLQELRKCVSKWEQYPLPLASPSESHKHWRSHSMPKNISFPETSSNVAPQACKMQTGSSTSTQKKSRKVSDDKTSSGIKSSDFPKESVANLDSKHSPLPITSSTKSYKKQQSNSLPKENLSTRVLSPPKQIGKVSDEKSSNKRRNFSKGQTRVLNGWLRANLEHPYPAEKTKEVLAKAAEITIEQVNNYYTNARRRPIYKKMCEARGIVPVNRKNARNSTTGQGVKEENKENQAPVRRGSDSTGSSGQVAVPVRGPLDSGIGSGQSRSPSRSRSPPDQGSVFVADSGLSRPSGSSVEVVASRDPVDRPCTDGPSQCEHCLLGSAYDAVSRNTCRVHAVSRKKVEPVIVENPQEGLFSALEMFSTICAGYQNLDVEAYNSNLPRVYYATEKLVEQMPDAVVYVEKSNLND